MNKFIIGFLAIVGAVLCWSANETIGSLVFREGASPLTLLTMRFGIATILVFLTLLFLKKRSFHIDREDWKTIGLGTVIMTAHLIGFWQGIKAMNSIVMAVAIFYLFPFWTAIMSWIFWKEKFSKMMLGSLVIGVFGALLAVKAIPDFGNVNLMGIFWMLVAGVGWSAYIMTNKKIVKKYNPYTILFYNFAGSVLIFMLLQSPTITFREITWGITAKTAFMAITASYGAFMFYNYALRYIKATTASIANLSKIFFSILMAYLILSQTATLYQIGGVSLIILGIYLLLKNESST